MRNNRHIAFDINRRMEPQENERLRNVVQQQEAQILALRNRIEEMAAVQRPVAQEHFLLSPEQFLNYVTKLRSFNGKDEYTIQEFISSVERTFQLCDDIPGLRDYAMGTIIDDKIQGEAKRCVQRLGANIQNRWEAVKRELKLHFRPRENYAELLNRCRSLRVSTLRELFEYVKEINYKLNELYEFDEMRPVTYHPSNNDKYLVDIISSKIHDFLRGNIPENCTLIEVYNKFDKLMLLDSENAVDFRSRKNKSNPNKTSKYENSINNKLSKNNSNTSDNNFNKNISNNNSSNSFNNRNIHRSDNYTNSYRNNYRNNSNQFRNQNHNWPQQGPVQVRNNPVPEPMEIGNLNQEQDVNFQFEPRNPESQ